MKYFYRISLLLACLIFSGKAVAANCNDSVYQKGTAIYFINGILNDEEGAYESLYALEGKLTDLQNNSEPVSFGLSYNENESIYTQVIELAAQHDPDLWKEVVGGLDKLPSTSTAGHIIKNYITNKISSDIDKTNTTKDSDLEEFAREYKEKIDDCYKVLVVAHSQGNFYANKAYDRLLNEDGIDRTDSFKIVSIANPDNEVGGDGYYTTLTNDIIQNVPASKTPNTTNSVSDDFSGHMFSIA